MDAWFPWWLNQFVHTNIIVFVLLEMFLLHHKFPCRKSALTGQGILMVTYLAWIHVIKYNANVWVYPVLAILNWPQRIAFYVFTLSVPVFLYYLGEFLNNQVWNKSRLGESTQKTKGKKSKSK